MILLRFPCIFSPRVIRHYYYKRLADERIQFFFFSQEAAHTRRISRRAKSYRSRNKVSSDRGGRGATSIASVNSWGSEGWSGMEPTRRSAAVLHLPHLFLPRRGGSHWSLALLFPQTVNRSDNKRVSEMYANECVLPIKIGSHKRRGSISRIACQTRRAQLLRARKLECKPNGR